MNPWRITTVIALAIASLLGGGCSLVPGGPFGTVISEAPETIQFLGHSYEAFHVSSPAEERSVPGLLVLETSQLSPIGPADRADARRFPDRIVYAIAGVDPQDAVALIDRSNPNEAVVVAFIRDARSPQSIAGLCGHLDDASTRHCPAEDAHSRPTR